MKKIVIYYSLEGNTEYAAEKIARETGAETLRLFPEKSYPDSGFRKFFWGGKSAVMGEKPKLMPYEFDSNEYDMIIFGSPVWAGTFAPPLRTFINENQLSGKSFAAFFCQSGSGGEKAIAKLGKLLGTEGFRAETVLTDPKSNPTEENERKLADFCDALKD